MVAQQGGVPGGFSFTPFTEEVTEGVAELLRGVRDVAEIDEELGGQLEVGVKNLEAAFEAQVLLMFKNWGVGQREAVGGLTQRATSTPTREAVSVMSPRGTTVRTPHTTRPTGVKKQAAVVSERETLRKNISFTLHTLLQALSSETDASRATLYLYDKTTSTLRSVCAVPASTPSVVLPSHTGVQGSVFTTTVAFNLQAITEDIAQLTRPADSQTESTTSNVLVFPLTLPCQQQPLGVLEFTDKNCDMWGPEDELTAHYGTVVLSRIVKLFGVEMLQGLEYNNKNCGRQQADLKDALQGLKGLGQANRTQLIVRCLEEKGKGVSPISDFTNVKEIHNYLTTLEEGYRRGLNQCVLADGEKDAAVAELSKKTQRTRVLEENVAYLATQVHELETKLMGKAPDLDSQNILALTLHTTSRPTTPPSPLSSTIQETLELAHRVGKVLTSPPPPPTDHRLYPLKHGRQSHASASLNTLRDTIQRGGTTGVGGSIIPQKYTLGKAERHKGGRMKAKALLSPL